MATKDTMPSMQAVRVEPELEPVDYQLAIELRNLVVKYGMKRIQKVLPIIRTDNL